MSRRPLTLLGLGCLAIFCLTLWSWQTEDDRRSSALKNQLIGNSDVILSSEFIHRELDQKEEYSILGKWLRTPEDTPPPSVKYPEGLLILVWKYGPLLHDRHVRFPPNNHTDWWKIGCSVDDCRLSYDSRDLEKADAVIFHLHRTRGRSELPLARGKPGQLWIFLTDESPRHTFLYGNQNISEYDGIFDWSMTYRHDSDIPVPYGRTVKRKKSVEKPEIQKKNRLVAVMGSNCAQGGNRRWEYVEKLKKILGEKLDVYGRCLNGDTTTCPGHFRNDCKILKDYKFYLAFENTNCREYLTEKVFWNAFEKNSVPIIMGAARKDCEFLLPPGSFIHVEDFSSPGELADYILRLDSDARAYQEYHEWRRNHRVLNEHGYFGSRSVHYCRICEALRYNTRPSSGASKYRRLADFWNSNRDCFPYVKKQV